MKRFIKYLRNYKKNINLLKIPLRLPIDAPRIDYNKQIYDIKIFKIKHIESKFKIDNLIDSYARINIRKNIKENIKKKIIQEIEKHIEITEIDIKNDVYFEAIIPVGIKKKDK